MLATVVRIAVVAVALWVATLLVPGIEVTAGSTEARVGTLLAVALVFGVVNAVVKPSSRCSDARSTSSRSG